jgi:hypothetical protein
MALRRNKLQQAQQQSRELLWFSGELLETSKKLLERSRRLRVAVAHGKAAHACARNKAAYEHNPGCGDMRHSQY